MTPRLRVVPHDRYLPAAPRLACRDCGVQVMALRDLSRGCIYVSDHVCAPLAPSWGDRHPRLDAAADVVAVVVAAILLLALIGRFFG